MDINGKRRDFDFHLFSKNIIKIINAYTNIGRCDLLYTLNKYSINITVIHIEQNIKFL